ncbi:unnamed protein product [Caenorhabditis angaria]|uniref:Uncharacterized protein n=1 Tax=Caenorhabditis angaria TaxID=860376 RepID=A0A9P1J4L3_9PELO|nr:unnamed protein product [Caenorhabditis angaria]
MQGFKDFTRCVDYGVDWCQFPWRIAMIFDEVEDVQMQQLWKIEQDFHEISLDGMQLERNGIGERDSRILDENEKKKKGKRNSEALKEIEKLNNYLLIGQSIDFAKKDKMDGQKSAAYVDDKELSQSAHPTCDKIMATTRFQCVWTKSDCEEGGLCWMKMNWMLLFSENWRQENFLIANGSSSEKEQPIFQ